MKKEVRAVLENLVFMAHVVSFILRSVVCKRQVGKGGHDLLNFRGLCIFAQRKNVLGFGSANLELLFLSVWNYCYLLRGFLLASYYWSFTIKSWCSWFPRPTWCREQEHSISMSLQRGHESLERYSFCSLGNREGQPTFSCPVMFGISRREIAEAT